MDDAGYYCFLRAVRVDEFGAATLIETSGGGVEPEEDLGGAIRRELLDVMLSVCNGRLTKAEAYGFSDIAVDHVCRFV